MFSPLIIHEIQSGLFMAQLSSVDSFSRLCLHRIMSQQLLFHFRSDRAAFIYIYRSRPLSYTSCSIQCKLLAVATRPSGFIAIAATAAFTLSELLLKRF